MENSFLFIFLILTAAFAFFAAYQSLKNQRTYWFALTKTGLKSEKTPKWLAYIQGICALVFGIFILILALKALITKL